jgi:hypothetical protein
MDRRSKEAGAHRLVSLDGMELEAGKAKRCLVERAQSP